MASSFPLKKNTAVKIIFPIYDDDGDLVIDAANLDSEYSIDGAQFVDCTNEATIISTATHKTNDTTNTVTSTNASDLATAITLANEIKADYNIHIASTTYHNNADSTNGVSSANASNQATLETLLNEIKADYNAHRTQGAVHSADDTKNVVASADASDLATAITLANEIKADYNIHLSNLESSGAYYLELVAAETNGDVISILIKTSSTTAKTTMLVFYTAGQTLDETDTVIDEIPSETNAKTWNATALQDIEDQVDDSLNKAIPGSPVADSINERVKAIDDKLPSSSYLKGTADSDGGMDTADKADVNTEVDNALNTAIPGSPVADSINERVVNIDTDVEKIFDADMGSAPTTDSLADKLMNKDGSKTFDKTTDSLEAASDAIATNLTAITSIQNNTRFTAAIPEQMQKPDSSTRAFRWTGNLYDTDGNMEDPNDAEILVRVLQADGTAITANLYKEQALTNPLDDATDQVNFLNTDGWRAMERLGVGQFDLFYKVAHDETEEALTVEFGWEEGTSIIKQTRATEVVDYAGDIEDIQAKVDDIHVKTDAGTASPTIPAQITTHDTDIKALPNIKATPEFLVIPSGVTRINIEGGVTAIVTTIALYDSTVLQSVGIVKIGTELISYTGISTDGELTGCTRGYNSTTPAIHADQAAVYEVVSYPLRLMVFDNAGNMKAPDSAPTIEIVDWAGTQELAPTAMTLISTGLYGYDYFMYQTDSPESKTLRFSIIVDAITTLRHSTLMVLDTPASTNDVIDLVGGGTGEYAVTESGWYDGDGIFTAWTDVMAGYLRDSVSGSRLDDILITAYEVINGVTIRAVIPPGQTNCTVNGTYELRLDAGTYVFKFYKDQYQFPTDEVSRTIT